MVRRKIQNKNEIWCCYFDERNLHVIHVKDLKPTTCPLRLVAVVAD